MVTVLLALGIASFAFPGLLSQAQESASLLLTSAVRGIIGLVLIFNVYTVYQQLPNSSDSPAIEQASRSSR